MADGQIHVTQVRSAIGVKPKQRGTLRALGLGRIGRTSVLPDRPEIRGMVANVVHLVKVESDGPDKGGPDKAGPVMAGPVRAGPIKGGVKK
jgi:large subunit ribosomal protein L30